MANSRTPPPDFEPGPSSAEALNQLPRGCIAQRRRSSDSSNTSTIQAVLATDGTVPLESGRRYRISGLVSIRSDIVGGTQVALHLNGSQIQRVNNDAAEANSDLCYPIFTDIEPATDDYTVELMVGVSGSDGNQVQSRADGAAGVNGETLLFIDDVGPAYT